MQAQIDALQALVEGLETLVQGQNESLDGVAQQDTLLLTLAAAQDAADLSA
jgi:hypothetical protein